MVTCPNPSCGKVFEKPLKTINLKGSAEPYAACPYCLTKILDPQHEDKSENEPVSPKEKTSKNDEDRPACHYHLGYLSEREDKKQIPDDCLVCGAILECMLQKMKV